MYKNTGGEETDRIGRIGVASGASEGYAVMAGVDAPLWGGKGMFAVGWSDAESAKARPSEAGNDQEFTRFGASVGYSYPLSKRTNVYSALGWHKDKKTDNVKGTETKPTETIVYLGMRHRF